MRTVLRKNFVMNRAAFFILSIFLILIAMQGSAAAQSWFDYYEQGMEDYYRGDFKSCSDNMKKAFDIKPESGTESIHGGRDTVEYYPHWYLCECLKAVGEEEKAKCHCEGRKEYEKFVQCICRSQQGGEGEEVEVVYTYDVPTYGLSLSSERAETGGEGRTTAAPVTAIGREEGVQDREGYARASGTYEVALKFDRTVEQEREQEKEEREAEEGREEAPTFVKIDDRRMSVMEREARAAVALGESIHAKLRGEQRAEEGSRRRRRVLESRGEVPLEEQEAGGYSEQQSGEPARQPASAPAGAARVSDRPDASPVINVFEPQRYQNYHIDREFQNFVPEKVVFSVEDGEGWIMRVWVNGEKICTAARDCLYTDDLSKRCSKDCSGRHTHHMKIQEGISEITVTAEDNGERETKVRVPVNVKVEEAE